MAVGEIGTIALVKREIGFIINFYSQSVALTIRWRNRTPFLRAKSLPKFMTTKTRRDAR